MSSTTTIDAVQAKTWAQEETLRSILRKIGGQATESKKQQPDVKVDVTPVGAAISSLGKMLKTEVNGPVSMFNLAGKTAINMGSKVSSVIPGIEKLGITAGMFGVALEVATQALGNLYGVNKVFLDVYESGVRVQGGMQGLIVAAAGAGMTLDEFSGFAKKNSSTFALMGNSTPGLIKQFQKMTGAGGELMMSQSQANEAFMETAEILQNTGGMVGMTNEKIINTSIGLIKETEALSKETGRSRQSILDFASSITKSGAAYLLTSTLSKDAQESFRRATLKAVEFGDVGGKMLMDNVQKFVAGGGSLGLLDDNFRTMLAVVPGGVQAFTDFATASSTAGGDVEGTAKQLGATLSNVDSVTRNNLLRSIPELAATLGGFAQAQDRIRDREEKLRAQDEQTAKKQNISIAQATANRLKEEKDEAERNKDTQKRMQELSSATIALNAEFSRIFVSVGELIVPPLKWLAQSINGTIDAFQHISKWIGVHLLGQTSERAEATSGGIASLATIGAGVGAALLAKKSYSAIFNRGAKAEGESAFPQPPPTSGRPTAPTAAEKLSALSEHMEPAEHARAPRAPTARAGGLSRLARTGAKLGGMGALGIAGDVVGGAIGGTTGDILSTAASGASMGAMLGSVIPGLGTAIGGAIGGVLGAGYGAYTAYTKKPGEEHAGEPGEVGAIFKTLSDSSMVLSATFSNMNSILSTGIISNLSQLGTNLTNIQGMPDITRIINERSSQISNDLQESLSPILGGTTTSNDNAIFQDSAQTYYQSSNVYYDRSLQLFTDIRDSNLNIRNDIATMRSLIESYVRTVRTLPQGAVQPAGVPV